MDTKKYTFTYENSQLMYKKNNEQGRPIITNGLNKQELIERFYGDIYKDFRVSADVNTSRSIINNCFKNPMQKTIDENLLKTIYDTHWPGWTNGTKTDIQKKTEFYPPLLRLTTDNSISTQISEATFAFQESGYPANEILKNPNITKIVTPATILDTAGTNYENVLYFPDNNDVEIVFDELFFDALGFPKGTFWSTKLLKKPIIPEYNVIIQYPTSPLSKIDSTVKPISTNSTSSAENIQDRFSDFKNYSKGNDLKNIDLENIKLGCDEKIKIFVTKELGDVAQVLMYLAYMIVNNIKDQDRRDLVMITTDKVVFYISAILNVPCICTANQGSQEDKTCQPVYFRTGPVNYENIILANKNSLEKHNNGQILALQKMIDSRYKDVAYVELKSQETDKRQRKPSEKVISNNTNIIETFGIKSIADFRITEDHINSFDKLFDDVKKKIQYLNTELNNLYKNTVMQLSNKTDDARIKIQIEFEKTIEKFRFEQSFSLITITSKLDSKKKDTKYILHPGTALFNDFIKNIHTDEINAMDINEFKNIMRERIDTAIKNSDKTEDLKIRRDAVAAKKAAEKAAKVAAKVIERGKKIRGDIIFENRIGLKPQSIQKKPTATRRQKKPSTTRRPIKTSTRKSIKTRVSARKGGNINDTNTIGYYERVIIFVLYNIGITDPIALPIVYDMIASRMSSTKGFNQILLEIFGVEIQDYFGNVIENYSDEEIDEYGLEIANKYMHFSELDTTYRQGTLTKGSVEMVPDTHSSSSKSNKNIHTPTSIGHSPSEL